METPDVATPNAQPAPIKRQRMTRLFAMIFAVLVIFSAGGATAVIVDQTVLNPQVASADETDVPSSIKEAWTLIHDRYVDTEAIDDEKLADGAISGMLEALGDEGHTRYLNPEDVARYQDSLSGTYVGVGIQVAERDDRIVVVSPIDQSPAQRAGVQSGDILIRINGQTIEGQTLDQVIEQVRGPEGSSVDLTFERPGASQPVNVTLERARLEVTAASWTMLPGNIAQIRLSQFSQGAADQVGQAISEAEAAGATAIVFDLRNNPGGLVDEAIGVASNFLPEGTPVFVTQVRDGSQTIHRARFSEHRTMLPVTVLVNEGTASSSEIVSGALKDNGRAKVVGEQTFGTGTLLNQFGLSNGGAALIGTELWLTPSETPIRGQGIVPNITISLATGEAPHVPEGLTATEDDIASDAQLLRAISVLNGSDAAGSYASGCSRCM